MASLLGTTSNVCQTSVYRSASAIAALSLIVLLCGKALPNDQPVYGVGNNIACCQPEIWNGWQGSADRFWSDPPGPLVFTFDWRFLAMCNSHTSYQFGTPPGYYRGDFAPLSKLDWSLSSAWTGFRFGLEEEDSAAHLQWLLPMGRGTGGGMYDYDWNIDDIQPNDPTRLDSLSRSSQDWREGQMLELEYEFRLLKCPLGLPLDVWPLIGFRWQRFDITGYAGDQIIPPDGPFAPPFDADIITFKQDYSIGYIGAQIRGRFQTWILPPIAWTLQGDWGYTQANNVDHHLFYEYYDSHRYTMEDTHGDAWHVSLAAEALYCLERLVLGVQVEHTEIRSTGTHHWLQYGGDVYAPADEVWSNGVSVASSQTAITGYIRLRF
jgi:hypothetical protein